MNRDPSEMTAYASDYPGVMHLPTRLPHIDRCGHAWCWCGVKNGRAVGGDAQCDECRNRPKPKHAHITYGHGSIAQLAIAPDASIVAELVQVPEERHESVRLFTPAPNQLDGQLSF